MDDRLAALVLWLRELDSAAVAVSGGVDSMTLAVIAHRAGRGAATMFHAVSPAVPPEATERVRRYAHNEGWDLQVFDAGEFGDADYLQQPGQSVFLLQDTPVPRDRRPNDCNAVVRHEH